MEPSEHRRSLALCVLSVSSYISLAVLGICFFGHQEIEERKGKVLKSFCREISKIVFVILDG